MNPLEALVMEALEDIKATDIKVIDVQKLTSVTDRLIVATGNSSRQVKAIAENVVCKAKEQSYPIIGIEGENEGEWILVDLGDLVVHIMLRDTREFYSLEKLWDRSETPSSGD